MAKTQTESVSYQIPIDILPLNVVVYRYDGSDFIIIDFNKQAQITEGLKKEVLLGKKLCDVFPGVKSFGLYDVLLRVHEKGGSESFDDAHYSDERISGWRKNEITKLPNGDVMAIYEDLTKAKQLEAENHRYLEHIKESEEKFRAIAENKSMGIFIYQEYCTYINDALVSLSGYSREELYKMKIWELVDTAYQEKVKEIAEQRLEGKQFPYTYQDIKVVTKSGQIKTMRVSTETISYNGSFAGMGTMIDITDIKETKEQLKILAQAIEQTDDLVKIINTKGQIIFVNDSGVAHSGYTRAELIGARTSIFKSGFHDSSFYSNLWQTVTSGKIYRNTFVNKRKDGSIFYEEETITPTLDENGKIEHYVSTGKDISKRVELENQLRESETNFRNLFNKSSDGIVIHDLEGNFLEVNNVICDRLGYTKDEMIGKNLTFIDTPELQNKIEKTIQSLQETGHLMFEGEHRKKDGTLIPVEINATIVEYMDKPAVLSVVRDITQRRFNERALHDAEELYHKLFDLSPVGILVIEPETGKAVEFNRISHELLGYTAEEFPEISIRDYEVHETTQETDKHIEELRKGNPEVFETKHRTKNGEDRDVVVSAQLISVKNKPYIFSVYHDITQQKENEKALNEAKAIAEASNVLLEKQAKTLEEYAFLDPLTHLANRRKFDKVFDVEWRRALRNKEPLSVCMIDIDFFKGYNDSLGHDEGDICLEQVASAISKSSSRGGELAARYGGEEFIVLLPHCDEHNVYQSGENIRQAVEALEIRHPDSKVASVVTISVGCATLYPSDNKYMKKDLVKFADEALYKAKDNGRNRVKAIVENTLT